MKFLTGLIVFCFGLNLSASELSRQETIAKISSYIASRDLENFKELTLLSLNKNLNIGEVMEIIAHESAYIGFPMALNAQSVFNEMLKENGFANDTKNQREIAKNIDNYELGTKTLTTLLGGKTPSETLYENKALDYGLKAHLFGFLFSSDILSFVDREVVVIAALSSMNNTDSQLNSHINVAKNIGLSDSDLKSIANVLKPKFGQKIIKILGKKMQDPQSDSQILIRNADQKIYEPKDDYFSKKPDVKILFAPDKVSDFSVGVVKFKKGSHTAWHYHPAGQKLIVTDGVVYSATRDGKVFRATKGEAIFCPPNVQHWHGAGLNEDVQHIAITNIKDEKSVVWLEKLRQKDYENFIKKADNE